MTFEEISRLIQHELSTFSYQPPAQDAVLGKPFSKDRMAQEVEALRSALVTPQLLPIDVNDDPRSRTLRMMWVVTRPDSNGYVLVFDQEERCFGLALTGGRGRPTTVGIWGDLVSTYAAR